MYLLSPTLKEFNEFIHCLDKLLSENLNKAFFQDLVALEREVEIAPGRFRVESKNTIALLDEWLSPMFASAPDYDSMMIAPLRNVRSMRQKPAHSIVPNVYDMGLIDKQTAVMDDALTSLRNICHHLQRHPNASNGSLPSWYRTCNIVKL